MKYPERGNQVILRNVLFFFDLSSLIYTLQVCILLSQSRFEYYNSLQHFFETVLRKASGVRGKSGKEGGFLRVVMRMTFIV